MQGRKALIKKYKEKGYKIIAVTNQGGVGLGYMTHDEQKACLHGLNEMMDFMFDDMLYASAKPAEKHDWTKPNPGMLTHAMEKHNINAEQSIMVGDRISDKGAADNAGVKFEWADKFFGDKDGTN